MNFEISNRVLNPVPDLFGNDDYTAPLQEWDEISDLFQENVGGMKRVRPQWAPPPVLCQDPFGEIASRSTIESLCALRGVSKCYKQIAEEILIARLNQGSICLSDIGLCLRDAEAFFGKENCLKISRLDLKKYCKLNDHELRIVASLFPNVEHLFLSEVVMTKNSEDCFKKLTSLVSLELHNCSMLWFDISFLATCPNLEYLDLSLSVCGDLSAISSCQNLKHLDLFFCNYSILDLRNLTQLKYLDLSHYLPLEPSIFQFLETCSLETLKLMCRSQIDEKLFANYQIKNLDLSFSNNIYRKQLDLSFQQSVRFLKIGTGYRNNVKLHICIEIIKKPHLFSSQELATIPYHILRLFVKDTPIVKALIQKAKDFSPAQILNLMLVYMPIRKEYKELVAVLSEISIKKSNSFTIHDIFRFIGELKINDPNDDIYVKRLFAALVNKIINKLEFISVQEIGIIRDFYEKHHMLSAKLLQVMVKAVTKKNVYTLSEQSIYLILQQKAGDVGGDHVG